MLFRQKMEIADELHTFLRESDNNKTFHEQDIQIKLNDGGTWAITEDIMNVSVLNTYTGKEFNDQCMNYLSSLIWNGKVTFFLV